MHDPSNQTSLADGTLVNSGDSFQRNTGPTQNRTWFIEFTFNNFASDFQLVAEYQTTPNYFSGAMDFTGLTACAEIDRDGDGIADKFDLDSDDDTCSDAKEGAAIISKTDSLAATTYAEVGPNGFADAIETSNYADATYNFISTYPLAQTTLVNACQDFDDDLVGDVTDIDDDNDGIPDHIEMTCSGINEEVSEVNTKNGISSGIHTAKAIYALGTDTLTMDVVITSTTNYNTNDGQEDGAWNFVSHNGVAGTMEDYTFQMPMNNVINGNIKWGPNLGVNTNTTYNLSLIHI